MRIEATCTDAPHITLEVFTPPGHDKIIIQRVGQFPRDGIPLVCLGDLVGLLTRYLEEVNRAHFKKLANPYESAAANFRAHSATFTPCLVPGSRELAYFMLRVKTCAACDTTMVYGSDSFPNQDTSSLMAQLERANWEFASGIVSDFHGGELCETCANQGKAQFKCWLCEQAYPYVEAQERIGDPPDILCKHCYETESAKEWEEAKEAIYRRHRYEHDYD